MTGGTVVLCGLASIGARAQPAKEHWKRVYTGEDSIVELDDSSSRFEPGNILRADFRTVFSNAERIGGQSGAKYKTRLETIDFKLNERQYRFFEVALLDAAGKLIQKRTADASDEWRSLKRGGITERLFNAASLLMPFGAWKVVEYRFAEADPKGAQPTPELDRLIGVIVDLRIDLARVGEKVCSSPSFEHKSATQEELMRDLGIEWKTIGIKAEQARTINLKCAGGGWRPPQSLLVHDNSEEMLMLWDGVFLVLKRAAGDVHRTPGRTTLKRHP